MAVDQEEFLKLKKKGRTNSEAKDNINQKKRKTHFNDNVLPKQKKLKLLHSEKKRDLIKQSEQKNEVIGANKESKKQKIKYNNNVLPHFKKPKFLHGKKKEDVTKQSEQTNKIIGTKMERRKEKIKHNNKPVPKTKKPKLLHSEKQSEQKNMVIDRSKERREKPFHPNKVKKLNGLTKNPNQNTLKPKKLKLFEMKRKDRKKARQQNKNKVYPLGVKTKLIWENLRREDCPPEKKHQLLKDLSNLVKGHTKELIFAHDTVRVIECLVTLGSDVERTMVFEELKDSILPVSKSKYAKFFLLKMLKYGNAEQKDYILKCFHGNVLQTVRHVEASSVLEFAYNEHANAVQRAELTQEFYGPHFAIFKNDAKNLKEVFEKDPLQKKSILAYMKEALLRTVGKSVISHSIVHCALREFMTHADLALQAEVIEAIREIAVEMLHTKDGARVAMNCVWNGTAKDRKVIIKSFKSHVIKIAKEESGHMVLLAVFDSADDTVLVQRVIIKELVASLHELAQDVHGRKVLLYLLCPRDPHFFHQDVVNILKQGDNSITKKKSSDVRQKELKEAISGALLKLVEDHASELIINNATSMFTSVVLIHAEGDFTNAVKSIAHVFSEPYTPAKDSNLHPVEHPAVNFMLKKLMLDDRNKQEKKAFSEVFLESIPEGVMSTWCNCNRGAFILLSLLETGIDSVMVRVKREMKGLNKLLSKKSYQGAKLLLEKLKR